MVLYKGLIKGMQGILENHMERNMENVMELDVYTGECHMICYSPGSFLKGLVPRFPMKHAQAIVLTTFEWCSFISNAGSAAC